LIEITGSIWHTQTYKNIDLIKILEDSEDGYNLAKVRNIGAIES
jgi:hypothetical protein